MAPMAKGAPRKSLQRIWHADARMLREQGLSYHQIAVRLNVTQAAVYFALNPDRRAQYEKKRRETLLSRAAVSSPA